MVKCRLTKKAKPVLCIETGESYNSMLEAERKTGLDHYYIKKSCENGKAYKGYHWRLVV